MVLRSVKARWLLVLLFVACWSAFRPSVVGAHDIPSDITIRVIVRPDGDRLRLMLRVPLRAMRDISFPVTGPGYLLLEDVEPFLRDAALRWIASSIRMYESGQVIASDSLIAVRISIPSNTAFGSYETAVSHVRGDRLPVATQIHWQNAMMDLLLEYPIGSEESRFAIEPNLERLALRVLTVLRFVDTEGTERVFQYVGNEGVIQLDPSWLQAALSFTSAGFDHILDGFDHLLFLLCLVIPLRRIRALVPVITAFTVGHSITLIGSAVGIAPVGLWFPPLVETLIALSIVYMALENIVGARPERRWMIAFGFGLVHGFGFSFALRESLQFAGGHLIASLLSFNIGVELGQLLVVIFLVPTLTLFFKYVVKERVGTIIVSALIAHTAWHWMVERWELMRQYRLQWPSYSHIVLGSIRWVLLAFLVAAGAWTLIRVYRKASEETLAGNGPGASTPTKEAV